MVPFRKGGIHRPTISETSQQPNQANRENQHDRMDAYSRRGCLRRLPRRLRDPGSPPGGNISKQAFGTTPDGQPVDLYTLRNSKGAEANIMTYGGIVQSLKMPDATANCDDVVLGFDTLDGYVQEQLSLLRRADRPLRQSHRRGEVHARRQDLHARRPTTAQSPARRRQGLRQGGLERAKAEVASSTAPRWN